MGSKKPLSAEMLFEILENIYNEIYVLDRLVVTIDGDVIEKNRSAP